MRCWQGSSEQASSGQRGLGEPIGQIELRLDLNDGREQTRVQFGRFGTPEGSRNVTRRRGAQVSGAHARLASADEDRWIEHS